MVFLLILLAVFVGLISVGAWRTAATFVFGLYSTLLLGLGFIVGGLLSFICFPNYVRTWHISDSWATMIIDDPTSSIPTLLTTPVVFIADLYRWMFEITLFQGTPFLWVTMLIAVGKVVWDARKCYIAFMKGRQEMIDLRVAVSKGRGGYDSSMHPIAETTLNPGYDCHGNFVGFKTIAQAQRHGFYN